jgi:membrane protein implicated in regulation of membrane protease activity
MSRGPMLVDVTIAIVIVAAVLLLANGMATVVLLALAVLSGLGITGVAGRIRRRRHNPSGRRRRQRRHSHLR